ncbi:MAG: hypothetical protein M3437_13695 [Chloroflexota bacterium]|nr:hypothetical protein [Chloroflexota bacterium]MDQ5864717.1 hypothetical protein [Chloroflexota bacterium]
MTDLYSSDILAKSPAYSSFEGGYVAFLPRRGATDHTALGALNVPASLSFHHLVARGYAGLNQAPCNNDQALEQ